MKLEVLADKAGDEEVAGGLMREAKLSSAKTEMGIDLVQDGTCFIVRNVERRLYTGPPAMGVAACV